MLEITTNFDLSEKNTFGLTAFTEYFTLIDSISGFKELFNAPIYHENPKMVLGGGSNILFTKNYEGLLIHPVFKGVELLEENDEFVVIRVGSGMTWDDLVQYAVENNWGGLENLTDIPGNVGAAPVQNIGAYGVEVKDSIVKVETADLESGEIRTFTEADCRFGYRTSIFKEEFKNKLLITHVRFRLRKSPHRVLTEYGTVEEMLSKKRDRSIRSVRQVIREIRAAKLPDYRVQGNAGSFFKNPIVEPEVAERILDEYPPAPIYPTDTRQIKLSAAWLIDQSGCKGLRMGNVATHSKQPLVIVNLGDATGNEVLALAQHIQKVVKEKFGIQLEPEVNIV